MIYRMISSNKYFDNVVLNLSMWSHICIDTEQISRLTPIMGDLKATLYDALKRAGRDTPNAFVGEIEENSFSSPSHVCVFDTTS